MWGRISGIATFGTFLIFVVQILDLSTKWKYGVVGALGAASVVGVLSVMLFETPKREAMLEKERKKAEIVQLLPSRTDRLEELWSEIEQLDLEIANMKVDAEGQGKVAQSMFYTAPEWMKSANQAGVEKKQNELFMKEQAYERLVNEQTRVYALTDAEWRAEQVEKIYVPE